MPSTGNDSDEDPDSALGLVMDRSTKSSTVSLEQSEQIEALSRQNAELKRRLMDAEKTLQTKLSEHESELEDLQGRLEEMRSELSATKREEKELRSKEVCVVRATRYLIKLILFHSSDKT
jgi:predicted RNase H-like nuclease (RuvC/YqgF family)